MWCWWFRRQRCFLPLSFAIIPSNLLFSSFSSYSTVVYHKIQRLPLFLGLLFCNNRPAREEALFQFVQQRTRHLFFIDSLDQIVELFSRSAKKINKFIKKNFFWAINFFSTLKKLLNEFKKWIFTRQIQFFITQNCTGSEEEVSEVFVDQLSKGD